MCTELISQSGLDERYTRNVKGFDNVHRRHQREPKKRNVLEDIILFDDAEPDIIRSVINFNPIE